MSVVLGYLAKSEKHTLSFDEIVTKIMSEKRFRNISEEAAREFTLNSLDSLEQERCVRDINGSYTLTCRGYKDFIYFSVLNKRS